MLAMPPNYTVPVFIVFVSIVSIFLYSPLREWLSLRRALILAFAASLVCIPIYSVNAQQMSAYNVGDVVLRWGTMNFTIGPGEVDRIDNISNIHAVAGAYLIIYCDYNVTFYLVDQNRPEIHHREANYSNEDMGFVLPYLYTEAGVPAQWSVCLLNANLNTLNVSIQPMWLEDSIEIAWWNIEYNLYLPLVLLFTVWIALGVTLVVLNRKRTV